MRPLREKRQHYGEDPTIEIQRPQPVRVRHQEPAKISGKRTSLGDLLDRTLDRLQARGDMPGYGKEREPEISQRERQRARRKDYLEGVCR